MQHFNGNIGNVTKPKIVPTSFVFCVCPHPEQTHNGESARLCTRCQAMLTMSESEILAIAHTYANERQFVDDIPSSSDNYYVPVAEQGPPAATAAPAESDERALMAMEDQAPSLAEQVAAAAMHQNWTFDECHALPDLADHLEKTRHVRFGDEKTSVATAKEFATYDREEDRLPWITAEEEIAPITAGGSPTTAGGSFTSFSLFPGKIAVFGMAAAAVGLIAWGARRR